MNGFWRHALDGGSGGVLTDDSGGRLVQLLGPLAGMASAAGTISVLSARRRLIEAGYRREKHLLVFMGGRVALAMALSVVALLCSPLWGLDELKTLAAVCTAAAVGFVASAPVRASSRWNT